MGTAYTPGLAVSPDTLVRKVRRLPIKGEVLVKVGEAVSPSSVVARTELPGIVQTLRVAEILGLEPNDAVKALRVDRGDAVTRGQVVAEARSFFGLFRSECKSPFDGTVELVSHATGHLGVRMPALPVEVTAYVDGVVSEIMPDQGVVVETRGAFVQGIFGIGGERSGELVVVGGSSSPHTSRACAPKTNEVDLTPDLITPEHSGKVLVGGAGVTADALRKASEVGVAGIVVGAVVDTDLIAYLGHDIGVAITGQEDIVTTVIVTEGFGDIRMAARTYSLLQSLEGRQVSINGATQIRAGVIRPEVIAAKDASQLSGAVTEPAAQELSVGTYIRIIREPLFGRLGTVTALPPEPREIETGAVVRVLDAKLDDGEEVTVPRANVEIIVE